MSDRLTKNNDPFGQQWLNKLKNGLDKIGKSSLYDDIQKLIADPDLIDWTQNLMIFLSENLADTEIKEVMCSCACRKPKGDIVHIRDEYTRSHDLKRVHTMLQESFEGFIKVYKNLGEDQMNFLRRSGWGLAGKLEGNVIKSIKIPKDFHNYFKEEDKLKKRYYYCHCPRIRESILANKPIDSHYCYCGAGFYKDIWEFILNREVDVEILKSVIKGDDVCQIAIYYDVNDTSS